jgi:hypothetical protein
MKRRQHPDIAIDDALFSAHDISGRGGVQYFALPRERVLSLLRR